MPDFADLPKLSPGDLVAVISSSAGLPGLFPWVQDRGLERLRTVFELDPVEYPTTRQMGSTPQDRARDVMAAFSDPANKAVFTSVGGDDQIQLLRYLVPNVFVRNPKPFFGYSDNTHLHAFLGNLGLRTYYGGAIMTQLAMAPQMHQLTIDSIRHALFDRGEFAIEESPQFTENGLDWADRANLDRDRTFEPDDGVFWDGVADVEGILWGGCVESLVEQCAANVYLPEDKDLDGRILFLETAEDIPNHWVIQLLLRGFGERGWLDRFSAILVGRPKTWHFDKPYPDDFRATYRRDQRDTVLDTVRYYRPDIPVVQNLPFGHLDPQTILPNGNRARLDATTRKVYLTY